MPTINGAAVSWSMPGFTFAPSTMVGTLILQSMEHSKNDEPETIKNASGQTCTRIWPDPSQDVMFEYFVSGASLAGSHTQSFIPDPGQIITLTFAATDYYVGNAQAAGLTAAGTRCEVQTSPKLSATNGSAKKISLPLKVWPLVTAAAS